MSYLLIYRPFWLVGFCVLGLVSNLYAQADNSAFERTMPLNIVDTGAISLWAEQLYYFKNNEYFTPFHDGYTLFGVASGPRLAWQLSPLIKISVGVYWRQDFGNKTPVELLPIFQAKYVKNKFSFIFGNLEGQHNHRLIEPFLDFERTILRRQEQGLQAMFKTKHVWFETWVDWQQMIYLYDAGQEHIQGGATLRLEHDFGAGYQLSVPLHLLAYHQGGQIDTSQKPIQTQINTSVGASISKNISKKSTCILKSEIYFLNFADNSPKPAQVFTSGHGIYANISIQNKGFTAMASYWNGYNYRSAVSNRLFWSQGSAINQTQIYQPRRKLIFVRLLKDWTLAPGLIASFRVEPLYDFQSKKIHFSHGVYLNLNTHTHLFKTKKN